MTDTEFLGTVLAGVQLAFFLGFLVYAIPDDRPGRGRRHFRLGLGLAGISGVVVGAALVAGVAYGMLVPMFALTLGALVVVYVAWLAARLEQAGAPRRRAAGGSGAGDRPR